jgi:hypothetical protein
MRRLTYSLIALTLLFFTAPGYTMSLFAKKCLFSEVNGVVLSAGKPVTGAEVENFYRWDGPDMSNRTTVETDNEGRFAVDGVHDNALMTYFLPTSPSIQQEIYIRYEGKEYEAYLLIKNNYEENGELDGKPLSFICELNDEPSRDSGFYGICTLAE